jgi:hypothetical protein
VATAVTLLTIIVLPIARVCVPITIAGVVNIVAPDVGTLCWELPATVVGIDCAVVVGVVFCTDSAAGLTVVVPAWEGLTGEFSSFDCEGVNVGIGVGVGVAASRYLPCHSFARIEATRLIPVLSRTVRPFLSQCY